MLIVQLVITKPVQKRRVIMPLKEHKSKTQNNVDDNKTVASMYVFHSDSRKVTVSSTVNTILYGLSNGIFL